MCGICGILALHGGIAEGEARIARMQAAMRHRGPDGDGISCPAENCLLGHVRLAIIAPTPEGAQPMSNPDTGDVITFNGEIYNFRELREELRGRGFGFRTASDTEVLLKAYECWGKDCLEHLEGIYAFAIWDARKRRLFAARDSVGVKPFYYYFDGNILVFASELRALLASGLVPARISPDGLSSLLAYGSVQEPFAMVDGVRSLSPGGMLCFGERLELKSPRPLDFSVCPDAEGQVGDLLEKTLAMQAISDVPLGVFLSGGIDSAAVLSLLSRNVPDVHAFTVAFEDAKLDERERAREMAVKYGANHHVLELDADFIKNAVATALDAQDQPSIDGINTWLVANAVHRAGMKVALSGLGGDELFAGYGAFYRPRRLMRFASAMKYVPGALRRTASAMTSNEGARKILSAPDFRYSPYFLTRQIMSADLRGKLGFASEEWMLEAFGGLDCPQNDIINAISFWEMSTYMRSTLLRDADCMGMANSLEIRVPLISPSLVRLLMRIPGGKKLDSHVPKCLLVRNSGVPEEYAASPKRGFEIPLESIVRSVCLDEARELFHNPPECGMDAVELRRLWDLFSQGRFAYQRIWCIFTALRWMANHIV